MLIFRGICCIVGGGSVSLYPQGWRDIKKRNIQIQLHPRAPSVHPCCPQNRGITSTPFPVRTVCTCRDNVSERKGRNESSALNALTLCLKRASNLLFGYSNSLVTEQGMVSDSVRDTIMGMFCLGEGDTRRTPSNDHTIMLCVF